MDALTITLGSFVLILVLSRLKLPLAGAIAVGAIVLGIWSGRSPWWVARTMALGVVQGRTIALAIATVLLLGLSQLMNKSGLMEDMVGSARELLRRPAVAMAALPALIGLLPMPGGALFSAPMVQAAAPEGKVAPGVLSAVNYWFRHIWEHWWPLYPGVMLASSLTGDGLVTFSLRQMPLGIIMAGAGLLVMRGTHPDLHTKGPLAGPGAWRRLGRATAPIWVILAVWLPAKVMATGLLILAHTAEAAWAPLATKWLPLGLGLVASLVWTVRHGGIGAGEVAGTLAGRKVLSLVLLVISVMVFQHVLDGVQAAEGIARQLQEGRLALPMPGWSDTGLTLHSVTFALPLVLVVILLPFIAGMVTGLAIGFVGTSFPIVLKLAASTVGPEAVGAYAVLAYGFGHLGQMVSPLHLCHVVSNRYFQTPFGPVYRRILPAAVVTGALGVAYFALLRWVG